LLVEEKRRLTLALLVTWVLAYHTQHALAANHAAIFTKLLDGWANSHGVNAEKIAAVVSAAGGEPTGVP